MNYSMTVAQVKTAIQEKLSHIYGVSSENASDDEFYKASALVVRDLMVRGRDEFVRNAEKKRNEADLLFMYGVPARPLAEEQPLQPRP